MGHEQERRAGDGLDTPGFQSLSLPGIESASSTDLQAPTSTFTSLVTPSAPTYTFSIPSGNALAYSGGGGPVFTLGADTLFPGRQAGGGNRVSVEYHLAYNEIILTFCSE